MNRKSCGEAGSLSCDNKEKNYEYQETVRAE